MRQSYQLPISEDCKSSILSAILSALFTFMSTQVQVILEEMETNCSYIGAPAAIQPDDDVALYRLFGFSLHASIHFRTRGTTMKRSKIGRKPTMNRITKAKRVMYCKQLQLLQAILEDDKSVIPSVIKLQDR